MKLQRIHRKYFRVVGDPSGNIYRCIKAPHDKQNTVLSVLARVIDKTGKPSGKTIVFSTPEEIKKIRPLSDVDALGAIYVPASERDGVRRMKTVTPDSMADDVTCALNHLHDAVGNVAEFVCERLQWSRDKIIDTDRPLLSAEQVDSVALAIYNMEARNQAIIIGDQTGIGKGRMAAAIIRYAKTNGSFPLFVTEKSNLFNDIYRDLSDIGETSIVPLISNTDSSANIKDPNDSSEKPKVLFKHESGTENESIYRSQKLPSKYDMMFTTYSQFTGKESKNAILRREFVKAIISNCTLILDEAHNASGSGLHNQTFSFFQYLVRHAKNVVFLSATYAKRAENMPLYTFRTCLSEANIGFGDLITAIATGGLALQEVISSQLVRAGQMVRRERSNENVCVNYITLDKSAEAYGMADYSKRHTSVCDKVTEILRDINEFDTKYIQPYIEGLKDGAKQSGEMVLKDSDSTGIARPPFVSRLFNITSMLLFSLKAEAVADRAIQRLKEGYGVVIAFDKTMGSTVDSIVEDATQDVNGNYTISDSYAHALRKSFNALFHYSRVASEGKSQRTDFTVEDLDPVTEAREDYDEILRKINSATFAVPISPIDTIVDKIRKAGFKTAECTGRSRTVHSLGNGKAIVSNRKKEDTNIAFKAFQNNQIDCLLINQTAATGASAHATSAHTDLNDAQVRKRVMIVAQAELDITKEVQKRGRINRTGQIYPPTYDYITSAIPTEQRLLMLLQKKLKSLDANTTSNQKQSTTVVDCEDFMNKYGDEVVWNYLEENPDINEALSDPQEKHRKEKKKANSWRNNEDEHRDPKGGIAQKVSGRVAILPCEMQKRFYDEIMERYRDEIKVLMESGEYDLAIEDLDLQAKEMPAYIPQIAVQASQGKSVFANAAYLKAYECKNLTKPYTQKELKEEIAKNLGGDTPEIYAKKAASILSLSTNTKVNIESKKIEDKRDKEIAEMKQVKKYQKLVDRGEKTWGIIEDDIRKDAELQLQKLKLFKLKMDARINRLNKLYPGAAYVTDAGENFVCLKVTVKPKDPTKVSLGDIKVFFASADANRKHDWNMSDTGYAKIGDLTKEDDAYMLNAWDKLTQYASSPTITRYVITGNPLKAMSLKSHIRGAKLVNYTKADGSTEKGLLISPNWSPSQKDSGFDAKHMSATSLVDILKEFKKKVLLNDITLDLTQGFKLECTANELTFYYVSKDKVLKEASLVEVTTNKDLLAIPSCSGWSNPVPRDPQNWKMYRHTAHFAFSDIDKLFKVLDEAGLKAKLSAEDIASYIPTLKAVHEDDEFWPKLEYDPKKIPANGKKQTGGKGATALVTVTKAETTKCKKALRLMTKAKEKAKKKYIRKPRNMQDLITKETLSSFIDVNADRIGKYCKVDALRNCAEILPYYNDVEDAKTAIDIAVEVANIIAAKEGLSAKALTTSNVSTDSSTVDEQKARRIRLLHVKAKAIKLKLKLMQL